MLQLLAFRRSLRVLALALCSLTLAVISADPASARPHHSRHAHSAHVGHHARHYSHHHHRHAARPSRTERRAQMQAGGFGEANAAVLPGSAEAASNTDVNAAGGFGSSGIVDTARRYLGGNPTSRSNLWCARFMNMVLQQTGHRGTGSDMASSFAHYGHRISGPQVGAIAVMGRRGGGHVGVVSGVDAGGNPIVISGNSGHRVRELSISRGRIYAYVMPN